MHRLFEQLTIRLPSAGVTMAITEERLTEIPLEFVKSFYSETNNQVKLEVGNEFDSLRSLVSDDVVEEPG